MDRSKGWGMSVFEIEKEAREKELAGRAPAAMLQQSAETFKQRSEVYGDNYKRFGKVMEALFDDKQINILMPEEWNRFGILVQIVSKLTRYCENFTKGGHDDSLNDISVYAAMLRSLDKEYNEVPF